MRKGVRRKLWDRRFFGVLLLVGGSAYWTPPAAQASEPLTRFMSLHQAESKRNHSLCYAYEDRTPGLPCNPAFLGIQSDDQLWIYGFGHDNFSYFQDVSDLVNDPRNTRELLPLLDHNSSESFQMSGSLGYRTNNWGIQLIPSRLLLLTHIRNPALPRLSLLIAREQEVHLQAGSFLTPEWAWGIQLRGIHRRFTYADAHLSDHFTDDLDELYRVRTQSVLAIEPSLMYAPGEVDWNPVFSVMMSNLELSPIHSDEESASQDKDYPMAPSLRMGVSLGHELEYGFLKFGTSTQWIHSRQYPSWDTSFGLTYTLSRFELSGTVSEFEKQVSLALNLNHFTTAVSYLERDWSHLASHSRPHNYWRWDLGFRF